MLKFGLKIQIPEDTFDVLTKSSFTHSWCPFWDL